MRAPYLDAPPAVRAAIAFAAGSILAVAFTLLHGDPMTQTDLGAPVAVAALAWWTTRKQR